MNKDFWIGFWYAVAMVGFVMLVAFGFVIYGGKPEGIYWRQVRLEQKYANLGQEQLPEHHHNLFTGKVVK